MPEPVPSPAAIEQGITLTTVQRYLESLSAHEIAGQCRSIGGCLTARALHWRFPTHDFTVRRSTIVAEGVIPARERAHADTNRPPPQRFATPSEIRTLIELFDSHAKYPADIVLIGRDQALIDVAHAMQIAYADDPQLPRTALHR